MRWQTTVTWSSNPNGTLLYTTETLLYSSTIDIYTYNTRFGPLSFSRYSLDYIYPTSITVVLKELANGTIAWAKGYSADSSRSSFAVSDDEKYVYYEYYSTSLKIFQFSANTGEIASIIQM